MPMVEGSRSQDRRGSSFPHHAPQQKAGTRIRRPARVWSPPVSTNGGGSKETQQAGGEEITETEQKAAQNVGKDPADGARLQKNYSVRVRTTMYVQVKGRSRNPLSIERGVQRGREAERIRRLDVYLGPMHRGRRHWPGLWHRCRPSAPTAPGPHTSCMGGADRQSPRDEQRDGCLAMMRSEGGA